MSARLVFGFGLVGALLFAAPAAAQPTEAFEVTVEGRTRVFLLHAPPGEVRPRPVMISFHGAGGTAWLHERGTGFSAIADREDFLVVYPQALSDRWRVWGDDSDVLFTDEILNTLDRGGFIDRNAVYASGFSLGAQMTWRLGCERPALFAAIAMVAGGYPRVCEGISRPPAIIFHGTRDPIFEYRGKNGLMGTQAFARAWASRGVCEVAEEGAFLFERGTAVAEAWSCDARHETELVTLNHKGHVWPGPSNARARDRDIDASEEIWRFLSSHRL